MEEGPTTAEMSGWRPGKLQTHVGSFSPHPVGKTSLLTHCTDERAEPRRTNFSRCRCERQPPDQTLLQLPVARRVRNRSRAGPRLMGPLTQCLISSPLPSISPGLQTCPMSSGPRAFAWVGTSAWKTLSPSPTLGVSLAEHISCTGLALVPGHTLPWAMNRHL